MRLPILLALAALPLAAQAVQVCDLDGQHVNPAAGHTTAGKTGPMRCRDGEGGPVVRERELRNGAFIGIVRTYKDGVLQREHSVNERGNRDGLAREFAATQGSSNQVLREAFVPTQDARPRRITVLERFDDAGRLRLERPHDAQGRIQREREFDAAGQLVRDDGLFEDGSRKAYRR
jgi:hypothetical protein